MAVAIESINLLVRMDRLAKVYPGGERALWDPDLTMGYHDGIILRLGAMNDWAMIENIEALKRMGLVANRDFGFDVSWVEYNSELSPACVNFKGDNRALVIDHDNFQDFLKGTLKPLTSRATVVVRHEGSVLLVREKNDTFFSLPGGSLKKGEFALTAAIRELHEEVGLKATRAERVVKADYKGSHRWHFVYEICAPIPPGELKMNKKEIAEYQWWTPDQDLPLASHVKPIFDAL